MFSNLCFLELFTEVHTPEGTPMFYSFDAVTVNLVMVHERCFNRITCPRTGPRTAMLPSRQS
jgi:hypothetical protein